MTLATLPAREMNKTEAAFAWWLEIEKREGRISWYEYEPFKVRLADKTYYTPDFLVVESPSRLMVAYEVKAFWKSAGRAGWMDDARVKVKIAAERFPVKFVAAIHHGGSQWEFEEF